MLVGSVVILILIVNTGSDCDARRDPFCLDLEDARRIERLWLALDAAVAAPSSFCDPCVPGAFAAARAARSAALEKTKAYRRYYKGWLKLAADTLKGFSRGLERQADSRRAVEQLLSDAEREYATLLQRMSSLPRDDSSGRALNELMGQVRGRISNLQEALSRWTDDRKSAESAQAGARTIQERMREAVGAVSAESLLWDAYYDGITTWNALRCGGLQ